MEIVKNVHVESVLWEETWLHVMEMWRNSELKSKLEQLKTGYVHVCRLNDRPIPLTRQLSRPHAPLSFPTARSSPSHGILESFTPARGWACRLQVQDPVAATAARGEALAAIISLPARRPAGTLGWAPGHRADAGCFWLTILFDPPQDWSLN